MKTLIRVGHSAYSGVNAYRLCFSKAQAVRVLCNRGVPRRISRLVVAKALRDNGATVYGEHDNVIEVVNEDYALRSGYYLDSYESMRSRWAAAPEL